MERFKQDAIEAARQERMLAKTPYERHQDLEGHPTVTLMTPAGPLTGEYIETCKTCRQRWLHVAGRERPLSMGVEAFDNNNTNTENS